MQIQQLLLGEVSLPAEHPRADEGYPIFAYLIHHSAGPILVDTGVAAGHEVIDRLYSPRPVDLTAALGEAGVAPADIVMVVNTHLHFDHTGHNREFPGVPVVAQHAEYAAALQPGYTVPEWIDFPGVEWQLVTGDTEIAPGVAVMLTRGHTPGHQAVQLETVNGIEIVAGQALHNCDELEAGVSAEASGKRAGEFTAIADRIKSVRPARVWFSHDSRVWPPAA